MKSKILVSVALICFFISKVCSDPKLLEKYFDCDGSSPYENNSLVFSALESKYLSPNGHGWRNELKKKAALRKNMYTTKEDLRADIVFNLSNGAKTVISQYHEMDTNTLVLVILSDTKNGSLENGIPNDGIFDVSVNYKSVDGIKRVISLGMIKNNEIFHYEIKNENGVITISINTKMVTFLTKDSKKVYLKFGDYLQAKDPITNEQSEHDKFKEFYNKNKITTDRIEFMNIKYCENN